MADDDYFWPFEIDAEPSTSIVDTSNPSKKRGGGALQGRKVRDIAASLAPILMKGEPWKANTNRKPDLLIHTCTCTGDDWRHKDIKLEISGGIAYIIMNRPNENNSMQDTHDAGISDAKLYLGTREDLTITVLTGEGRMFCSGGDPAMWQAAARKRRGEIVDGDGTVGYRIPLKSPSPEVWKHTVKLVTRAIKAGAIKDASSGGQVMGSKSMNSWAMLPQFTIALVNGSAMGGGVGYICGMDYAITVKRAFIVLSEVRIGVVPAVISPIVLRKMGASNGKRLFCTAENMSAHRSVEWGVCNDIVENMAEGHKKIKEICDIMTKCGPNTSTALKNVALTVLARPFVEPITSFVDARYTASLRSKEGLEGLDAQLKKQPMPWEANEITPLY